MINQHQFVGREMTDNI